MAPNSHERSVPETARAVATNVFWGSAGRILGGVFALVAVGITSRALGPEKYGGYGTILAFLYLFNAVADGGFYQILARDIAREKEKPERLVATAVTLRGLSLVVFLSVGGFVFLTIPKYHGLGGGVPLAAMSYAALSLAQLLMAVFQKELTVYRASYAEVGARVTQLVLVGILVFRKTTSVTAFLAVLAATSLLQLSAMALLLRPKLRVRVGTTVAEAKRMFAQAFPVGLSLLFTLIYFRLDTVLLSLMKSAEEVGIYNLSYKLLEQLIFFPAMFTGVLMPILSDAFLRDRQQFQNIFSRAASVIAIAALPMTLGGFFLAQPIAVVLGGEAFLVAQEPLRVLLIATSFIFIGTLLGSGVVIAGRQKDAIFVYALAMVVNVTGNLFAIPHYSYIGAAWTTVITELIVDTGLVIVLWRSNVSFRIPRLLRIAAAAGVMLLPLVVFSGRAIALLGAWSILPFVLFCPLLYGATLFLFRAITKEDMQLILGRANIRL